MTGSGGEGSDGVKEAHVKHRQCLCFEEMLTDHSLIFADGTTMLLMCVCNYGYVHTAIKSLCFLNSNSVCRF